MSKVLVDREEIEAVRNTLANGGGAVGVLRWAESILAQPAEAEWVDIIGYMDGDYRRDQPSIYIPHVRIVKSCAKGEALMTVTQHLAALSVVTAERDQYRAEVERLRAGGNRTAARETMRRILPDVPGDLLDHALFAAHSAAMAAKEA